MWKKAYNKLVPSGSLAIFAAALAAHYAKMGGAHQFTHKTISLGFDVVFVFASVYFLHALTSVIRKVIAAHRLGVGRAASIQFMIRLVGYTIVILMTLNLLNVSIGKLLLGGAVLGIIFGVAAQQALGNFFASIVLIISHPFSVGQRVTITSGSLGGKYIGTIKDIGLTHTKLKEDSGNVVLLPNTVLLTAASIRTKGRTHHKPKA